MASPAAVQPGQASDLSNESAVVDEHDERAARRTDDSSNPATPDAPLRPRPSSHLSTQSFGSPHRHHHRTPSTPRQVKETLHAHSEYTNSEDDGTAIHRINQYIIKQEIGRGSFGAVHRAVDQHGTEFAVKEFSKARLRKRAQSSMLRRPHQRAHRGAGGLNAPMARRNASDMLEEKEGGNSLDLIREEIAIMKKLNHHNLVALYEVLDDPTEDSLYMVMEMCKKGVVMKVEVGDRADPYDPESCRCWFRDLILGIEYLHAQGIIHRDIKPDNLLLDNNDVLKVVDFGVSEMFEKESDMTTTKSAGSPAFLPPELCVSRHGAISGKAVDIWSMGVTLYCLYHGKVPFEEASVLDLYESINKRQPEVVPQSGDQDFQDLILRLLEKNPDKRIQMEELREHPWVTRRGLDPLLSVEENTSDLIAPPTEEEMNSAITGNLSNLIVVMKAVRKFRRLLDKKRPYVRNNMLGLDAHIVQPPQSMDGEDDAMEQTSEDVGLQRQGKPEAMDFDQLSHTNQSQMHAPTFQTNIVQPTPQRPNFSPRAIRRPARAETTPIVSQNSPNSSFHDGAIVQSPPGDVTSPRSPTEHLGKGQAHDPLSDFRYLHVGSGDDYDDTAQPAGSPPAVCESPPAADLDIYEQAYHDEVQRIRARNYNSTLYLTRRVEDAAGIPRGDLHDGEGSTISPKSAGFVSHWGEALRGIVGSGSGGGGTAPARGPPRRQQTAPALPAAKVAAQAVMNRARDKGLQATRLAAQKMGGAAEEVQAKARKVQEGSTARLAERGGGGATSSGAGGREDGESESSAAGGAGAGGASGGNGRKRTLDGSD